MKKMNMYEAPVAEMIEIEAMNGLMNASGDNGGQNPVGPIPGPTPVP
jgi:hypothetical protein